MTTRARAVWVAATLAPLALIGGWTVAGAVQPFPYDATRETISELAQVGQPHRWVMTLAIAVVGACYLVVAVGLRRAHPAGRLMLGVGGLATVGVAAFALPSAAHGPTATVSFVALALWPALSGVPGRAAGLVATAVLLVLLAVFGLGYDAGLVGTSERLLAGAESLWPLVALATSRATRPEDHRGR